MCSPSFTTAGSSSVLSLLNLWLFPVSETHSNMMRLCLCPLLCVLCFRLLECHCFMIRFPWQKLCWMLCHNLGMFWGKKEKKKTWNGDKGFVSGLSYAVLWWMRTSAYETESNSNCFTSDLMLSQIRFTDMLFVLSAPLLEFYWTLSIPLSFMVTVYLSPCSKYLRQKYLAVFADHVPESMLDIL